VTGPAVLVDLDGTLVDTVAAWRAAYTGFARELGVEPPADLWARIAGRSMRESLHVLGPAAEVDAESAIARLSELAAAAPLGPDAWLPGAADLLASLAGAGLPHAVVTSSARTFAEHMLATGPTPLAPVPLLVCSGDTARAKPQPDPYLRAAELLEVEVRDCLVIEDSPSGVAAAEAAGMVVLVVPHDPSHRAVLPQVPGRARRDDLVGLDASTLHELQARLRSERGATPAV
jgi:HAD superfamily hydrolase (TIGR01509 family)